MSRHEHPAPEWRKLLVAAVFVALAILVHTSR